MRLELNIDKQFKEYLTQKVDTSVPNNYVNIIGIRYRFNFNNGCQASVVKSTFSYGGDCDLWEVAILKNEDMYNCKLVEENEVLGYLTDKDVNIFLYCVKNKIFNVRLEQIKEIGEIIGLEQFKEIGEIIGNDNL